jgi:hypothetical protein
MSNDNGEYFFDLVLFVRRRIVHLVVHPRRRRHRRTTMVHPHPIPKTLPNNYIATQWPVPQETCNYLGSNFEMGVMVHY